MKPKVLGATKIKSYFSRRICRKSKTIMKGRVLGKMCRGGVELQEVAGSGAEIIISLN
jgi:hypothetical protein